MTEADRLIRAAAALTVAGAFRMQVQLRGAAPALEQDGRVLSYRELDDRAGRLASVLAARGVAAGDRVAILAENCCEYVELFLAAARIGAIVACQNWRLADPELAHCLRLVTPALVIASARHAPRLARIDFGAVPTIVLGEHYESLLAASSVLDPLPVDPEAGLLILYTSGTTGLPKGALISHRAMLARAMVGAADWQLGREAFVAWTPLFHMGSADQTLATLTLGGTVIVMDGFDAPALVAIVARSRIGHLTVVPGVVDRLLAELARTGARAAGVRVVGVMADLVPPAQIAELTARLDAPYGNTFGSTETGMPPASRGLIAPGVAPHSSGEAAKLVLRTATGRSRRPRGAGRHAGRDDAARADAVLRLLRSG